MLKKLPFNEAKFKQLAPDCTAEYVNYMPRGKTGGEVIEIHPFVNRKERNEEICRLYYEKGVSQLFLANFFNMSQPSVSVIVNKK